MRSGERSVWLNRFAWFTAAATLVLIWSGGFVTSKGAGLAVPDWPTTFGYNMFFFPFSKWLGAIFYEHSHRLIASTVGLLTITLAIMIWLLDTRRWLRVLGLAAVIAVSLQGLLGGLRVVLLKDAIGIFHACLAQAFLGLLVFIAFATSRSWDRVKIGTGLRGVATIAVATTAAIYLQLALGATMRHQHRDLALLDFPTANGRWIPDTNAEAVAKFNVWRNARALSDVTAGQIWLQMTHRFGALVVATGVIMFWSRIHADRDAPPQLRTLSNFWLVVVVVQITLGACTIWTNKAADVATAHVAVGAVMLSIGVISSAIALRARSPWSDSTRTRPEFSAV